MKKIRKWKNQKLAYAGAALGVVLLISLLSMLLEVITNRAEKGLLPQTEYEATEKAETKKPEEEQDGLQETDVTEAESKAAKQQGESAQPESAAKEREEYAKELEEYEKNFQPEIVGNEEDIHYFLDSEEKKSQFLKTIADFTYSIFGNAGIDHIKIGSLVFEDEETVSYQIQLVSEEETMPCEIRYDKKNNIFGLY